jgi:hypothetical protein
MNDTIADLTRILGKMMVSPWLLDFFIRRAATERRGLGEYDVK